jgi:hypothetical protein
MQKAGDFLNKGVDKFKSIFKSHYHQELNGNEKVLVEQFLNENSMGVMLDDSGDAMLYSMISENIVIEYQENNIWYHGTNADINAKDLKNYYLAGDYGEGIYLTSSAEEAKRHGKNVLKLEVISPNPLKIGTENYFNDIYPEISNGGYPKMYMASKVANEKGYTSLIVDKPDSQWQILMRGSKIKDLGNIVKEGTNSENINNTWY